jgi:hypothetical protein
VSETFITGVNFVYVPTQSFDTAVACYSDLREDHQAQSVHESGGHKVANQRDATHCSHRHLTVALDRRQRFVRVASDEAGELAPEPPGPGHRPPPYGNKVSTRFGTVRAVKSGFVSGIARREMERS